MLLTHSSFFSLCRHSQMSALCGKIWDTLISCILGSLINSGCCQEGPVQRWQKPHKTGLCSAFSHRTAPQMILVLSVKVSEAPRRLAWFPYVSFSFMSIYSIPAVVADAFCGHTLWRATCHNAQECRTSQRCVVTSLRDLTLPAHTGLLSF